MFDNYADLIAHNARRRPRHVALIEGERHLTFAELDLLVTRGALALRASGVAQGDILGVGLTDTLDHVVMLLSIARLGAVILPMDHRWTAEETQRIVGHFPLRLIVLHPGQPAPTGVEVLRIDETWHALATAQPPEGDFPHDRDLPLLLSMSSGTTGMPKGPLLSHGKFLDRALGGSATENDTFLLATPLYFGGGRGFTLGQLVVGGTVRMFPPPYRMEALVEAVNTQGVTWTFLVPTQLRRLLPMAPQDRPLFPRLRSLVSSGSMLYAEERAAVLQRLSPNFINNYSSTEGGGISVLTPAHPTEKAGSVGRSIFMNEIQIVDDEHRLLPPGETGRIRHRSPTTATSFFNNPEESAKYFRDDWYYTGDLGWLDDDGFLWLAGRSKEMIIRGGVNIYPAEIEEPLLRLPEVQDCAAVAWPARMMGEEIALFVVPATPVTEERILDAAREHLTPYKVPRKVFLVEDLPKNAFGKVLRAKLAATLPDHDALFPAG